MMVMLRLSGVMVTIVVALIMAVVVTIRVVEVQGDVTEHHVLVMRMSDNQMLDFAHRTGDRGLRENKQKGNAKRCPRALKPRNLPVFHVLRLARCALASNQIPGPFSP